MASKLKNLAVTKVDFVDQGANPDAHIRLFKRRDGAGEGKGAGADSVEGMGQKEKGGIWKRLIHSIAKAAGMEDSDIQNILEDVEKGDSRTFAEEMGARGNGKIADEIWDVCMALNGSLCSILYDGEMDASQASDAMRESVQEFAEMMAGTVLEWCSGRTVGIIRKNAGNLAPAELEAMKSARDRLCEQIEKASAMPEENMEQEKGEAEEMKIDKSKLTPAERAFLEDIEKRCGEEETGGETTSAGGGAGLEPSGESGAVPDVRKSAHQENATPAAWDVNVPTAQAPLDAGDGKDIYKGLHPAVAAELQALQKYREQKETEELEAVAKRYQVLGRKPEELVQTFKSLKVAGGTAYDDMIATLDQSLDMVKKSGMFGEIGKSGGNSSGNAVQAKISDIAKGYMAKDPSLAYDAAVAKAWEDNPDIMAEYEEQEGF